MSANPITSETLKRGIDKTFTARINKRPPQSGEGEFDFDDSLYRELESNRRDKLDSTFWDFLVDTLWDWRAIRSKARPNTKDEIRARGLLQLSNLNRHLSNIVKKCSDSIARVESLEWSDVEPLFIVAQDIKSATKPTFGSKLCHFLSPSAYFIWDNKLVIDRWCNYEQYWLDCRSAWTMLSNETKQARIGQLKKRMPKGFEPCISYPWSTKIAELCQRS